MSTATVITQAKEQASAIIAELEDKQVSISGTANMKLETVVRYLNRDKISARGESWFRKNHDALTTDAVEQLINTREKAIVDYQNKKELADKNTAVNELVARGIEAGVAYKQVFGK